MSERNQLSGMGVTLGLRYYSGYFHLCLCWMEAMPPHHWKSSPYMIQKRYKSLDSALKELTVCDIVVMLFPA